MTQEPITTALQGCLERHADGWYWCDGTYEPRVDDVPLDYASDQWPRLDSDEGTAVGVPHDFRQRIPPGQTALITLIDALVREHGIAAALPAKDMDHQTGLEGLQRHGWLIPESVWNDRVSRPLGARWDINDEPLLLEKAGALGYSPVIE